MDKLTLEHLAPYLPYGLKVLDMMDNETKLFNRSYNKEENAYKLTTANLGFTLIKDFRFPLLRPLSDLKKEIEHNGERFIPTEWFEIGDDESENWFSFDHGNINLINDLNSISTHQVYHDINFLPYAVVQKLIEWHFDVFGLHDKGLCVYLNEI